MNKVFILIPTYNRKELLNKCLESIRKQTYENYETVVINDGSTDGTSEMIKKNFPNTTILEGNGNLWWTGAMRLGVDYVLFKAKKGDFILTMNDDTTFDNQYLGIIIEISKKNHRAIVGSICFDTKNKTTVIEAGVLMNWGRGRMDIALKLPKNYKTKKVREVDTFCGRGTLVPIEVFNKIGSFSKRLPHYMSDYEYFIRAKKAGWKLLIAYEAITYSTKKAGGLKFELRKKGWKRFFQELFSRRSRSNIFDKAIFVLLAAQEEHKKRNLLRIGKTFFFRLSYVVPFYYVRKPVIKVVKFIPGLIWCIKQRLRGLPC